MGLGVRLTGISIPFGGISWEYTAKSKSRSSLWLPPDQKIRVFISSIHGTEKYDTIRAELKTVIEATALANVYLSEEGDTLTLPSGEHYIRA